MTLRRLGKKNAGALAGPVDQIRVRFQEIGDNVSWLDFAVLPDDYRNPNADISRSVQ